jgi:hypothetical protein
MAIMMDTMFVYFVVASLSCVFFCFIAYLSHLFFLKHATEKYEGLGSGKADWNTRISSNVHAIISTILCGMSLIQRREMYWDSFVGGGFLSHFSLAVTTGYLLEDFIITAVWMDAFKNQKGLLFTTWFHHFLGVLFFTWSSALNAGEAFALTVVISELSTPFLNLAFQMQLFGYTEHPLYVINGVLLVVVFFIVRVIPQVAFIFMLWRDVPLFWVRVGPTSATGLLLGMVAAGILNSYWFYKLCIALVRKVMPKKGRRKKKVR